MSNYNFSPTLDGLNQIDSNNINSDTIITDYLTVDINSSVPTLASSTNTNQIASTAFVQSVISTIPTNYVTTDTTQTLTTGIKTFTNLPECSTVPTTANQLVNKNYVDNSIPTNYVTTNTSQTLTTGIKTFTNLPECSAVPTTANQLCNKAYVDSGAFVTLNTNQTISGQKTLTNFNYLINDNGVGSNNGTLLFQDSAGDGALMYYNNDDSAGTGGLRVVSSSYGFAFSSTTGAGEHCDFLSQNINFRCTDACNFTEFVIPPPTGGQQNQIKRGSIYDNTTNLPTFTFQNGQATDIGVTFNALNVFSPIGNTCNMVRVSIPFDLLAWSTFGIPSATATIGLRFDSFSVVFLKNGSAYTPSINQSFSPATGTTLNWNKTGAQSNIQGMGAYFGNLEIAFNIDINNTTVDTYQVRVNPQATITNYSINFDAFKFVCRNATGGQTNGNGFRTTSVTAFTGGTLTFAGGNPSFVDTSITRVSQSYPVPPTTASCYMPLNNNINPPASIIMYGGNVAPAGWLLCNGGSYNISTYPNLYAVIGNIYGGSFSAGTFSVPDTRGIFVAGNGSQVISGTTYSRTLATKQAHQLQDHKHTYSDLLWWDSDTGGGSGQTIFVSGADYQVPGGDNNGSNGDGNFSNRLTKATYPSTAVNPGTPIQQWNAPTNVSPFTGTDTYPANIAFNYIIKW